MLPVPTGKILAVKRTGWRQHWKDACIHLDRDREREREREREVVVTGRLSLYISPLNMQGKTCNSGKQSPFPVVALIFGY